MDEANESGLGGGRKRRRLRIAAISLGIGLPIMALAAYFSLPLLVKERGDSSIMDCQSNLHRIDIAIQVYANDNDGRYPETLGILLETEDITPDAFICPSSDDTLAQGPTTQAVVADLTSGGHLSYIYLGKKLTKATATANTVVVYEPLSDHHDHMNVLFGDGHVECITVAAAKQLLQKVAARQFPMTMPTRPLIGC